MKTQIRFAALFVATLGGFLVSSLNAAPRATRAAAQPVNEVTSNGDVVAGLGTTEAALVHRLGSPSQKLTENVWVYRQFQASPDRMANDDCSLLVLTFQNEKITDMKLVNAKALTVLAAQAKRDPSALAKAFVPAKDVSIETAANSR